MRACATDFESDWRGMWMSFVRLYISRVRMVKEKSISTWGEDDEVED